ncbi:MAG TPA: hypothetical protein VMM27_13200 [Casimicrobiaceae bacterium]|nr:hypothetical protein [Casimicrobiaceae bacterium]
MTDDRRSHRRPSLSALARTRCLASYLVGAALALAPALSVAQQAAVYDGVDGLACDYVNLGAGQRWRHRQGDWLDAQGEEQGSAPFAQLTIKSTNQVQAVEWPVTSVLAAPQPNATSKAQLLLRIVPGGAAGTVEFQSRESQSTNARPMLVLTYSDGTHNDVAPVADAVLDCSTYRGLGQLDKFGVGADRNSVIVFEVPSAGTRKLTRATLRLTTTDHQYGDAAVGVYALDLGSATASAATPPRGLAASYPGDSGIEADRDVYMATGFDTLNWRSAWSYIRNTGTFDIVASDPARKFEALSGNALRVNLAKGDNFGLDFHYAFADKVGSEPEEVYFRYYLRFGDDWRPDLDGGKLPGISGTYNRAGWGLRQSDGTNGWSMRGSFARWTERANPLYGLTAIGTYAYHADMKDYNGEPWNWDGGGRSLLARNRWYCIEQYAKVNTPGRSDGVLRAWIDGVLVYERTNIRMRTIPTLKIEMVWMNVYHGGTEPSPRDQHLYIDNVVIAKRYIGPMARPDTQASKTRVAN